MPVQSGDQWATLPLVVVQGDGSSLLGHDWLLQLRLDWKKIHRLQSTDAVENILLKHKEVFQKGLGIYVDERATPKFCKARTVPYSLRVKVEEELDRLGWRTLDRNYSGISVS